MQQFRNHQLVFRVVYNAIVKRYNSNVNSKKNKVVENEHRDSNLICPRWEEGIIKEERKPDLPVDIMQKVTIDMVNNATKQQPFLEPATEPST
jgi:hypothetical protein